MKLGAAFAFGLAVGLAILGSPARGERRRAGDADRAEVVAVGVGRGRPAGRGQPADGRARQGGRRADPGRQGLFARPGVRARHAVAGQATLQPHDPGLADRRPVGQEPRGLPRRPLQRRDRPDRHPARRPRPRGRPHRRRRLLLQWLPPLAVRHRLWTREAGDRERRRVLHPRRAGRRRRGPRGRTDEGRRGHHARRSRGGPQGRRPRGPRGGRRPDPHRPRPALDEGQRRLRRRRAGHRHGGGPMAEPTARLPWSGPTPGRPRLYRPKTPTAPSPSTSTSSSATGSTTSRTSTSKTSPATRSTNSPSSSPPCD